MSGPIRYDFAGLNDGHMAMMGGASGFDDLKTQWNTTVSATAMTWLSQDGVDFTQVNHLFDQAATATNEFLTRLGIAVDTCNGNAQETLQYCRGVVNG